MIRLTWTDADGVQHFGTLYGWGVIEEPAASGKGRPTMVTCAMIINDAAPDGWTPVAWYKTRPIGGLAREVLA